MLLNSVLACFLSVGIGQAITISANTTYSTNTNLTELTTIGANNLELTINSGVTVTQLTGGFNIGDNNLTLKGGGTLKINTLATVRISNEGARKTLTIDGMTLDLSDPASKLSPAGTYTRLGLMVKNQGIVKVDQFAYGGSFGSSALNRGYFQLDNGTIQITNAEDSTWAYGMNILAGGGRVEAMTAGKTVTIIGEGEFGQNIISQGARLTFAGVGDFNTGTPANRLSGAGGIAKEGTGTLTIGADQNFAGDVELRGGTLIAASARALGTNGNLKVTGNSVLGGISSAVSVLTLNDGVSLNVSSIDNNAGLTLNGRFELKGSASMTGNLKLGQGNAFVLSALPAGAVPLLTLTGTLTLDGALLAQGGGTVAWVAGNTYDIISATSISGTLTNLNDAMLLSDTVGGRWLLNGNKLQLTTFTMGTLTWAGGGNGTWGLNGTSANSPWNGNSVYSNENSVVFGDIAGSGSQTVTISGNVAPLAIAVNANDTNYVWSGAGSLQGVAELNKSGTGSLTINTANAGYSGRVLMRGGVIEMGTESALGTGTLVFNGGTLKYGTGVVGDISTRIAAAITGNDNAIRVDTNGNNVSWSKTITDMSYAKSGAGVLALTTADGTNYTNGIGITGGELSLAREGGSVRVSGNITGTGVLSKTGTGNFYITSTANDFNGTLDIRGGTTVVGAPSTTGTGAMANLGTTTSIVIGTGAAFRTHLGAGEANAPDFTFGNIYVKSGGDLGNIDGHLAWAGNVHFNVATIAADGSATYDAAGTSTLYQFYAKKVGLKGIVSGSGTVNLSSIQADGGLDHRFTLLNAANTFNGMYVIESTLRTTIALGTGDTATGGVASTARFKLGHANANLVIATGAASIAGLEGTAGNVSAEGGDRVLTINQAANTEFAGLIADTANGATGAKLLLVKDGAGSLTLNHDNTYTGDTTIKNGSLVLGTGMNAALGTGSVSLSGGLLNMNGNAMANALTITGGNLARAGNYGGGDHSVVISLSTTQGSLDLGGLRAVKVASISTGKAGTLVRGLGAGSLLLGNSSLAVGVNNLFHVTDAVYPGGSEYILGLSDASSTVSMNGGDTLTLDLADADLVAAMQNAASGTGTYQILVTNGVLNMNSVTLNPVGGTFEFVAIDGGNVVISGDASNIYAVASNQNKAISSNEALDAYNAVLVNGVLNLNLPGVINPVDGVQLKNLGGNSTGVINVTQTGGTGPASIILDVTDPTATYNGTLNGSAANFIKKGTGTQILGGSASMQNLNVEEGLMQIGPGGQLALLGQDSRLSNGTEITGSGSLALSGTLTLDGDSKLNGVGLVLNGANSRLNAGSSHSILSSLNGTGTLNSNNGSIDINTIQGRESTFQGQLAGSGSLNVAGNGKMSLIGVSGAGFDLSAGGSSTVLIRGTSAVPTVSYKSLQVQSGATVIVEAVGKNSSDPNTILTLASGGSLASGSTLAFVINTDYPGTLATGGSGLIKTQGAFTLASGSLVDVSSIDPNASLTEDADSNLNLILIRGTNGGSVSMNNGVDVKTSGLFDVFYENVVLDNSGGNLILKGAARQQNYFEAAASTENSAAGANLLWQNRRGLSSTSELGSLMALISSNIKDGNLGEASRLMAASAGSTVTSLLAAQRGSFREQQKWIRNRTNQMGVNQGLINEDLPYFNAWIQGNGSYLKLDESGDKSGYTLNSWGGTVGMDVDLNESFTFGAAVTADYGTLKARAADTAKGDMDTWYANLFARLQRKNWGHTLILTGAWTDSSLDRTVDAASSGYTTHGKTNGTSFGAMYEGTYDIALNAKKTAVFQPVVNAGIYSSRVDGYDETGAGNAGLRVSKMDETVGTIAVGGRLMGMVGNNLFGREVLGELRVMVSQDMGGMSRSATVGYLQNPAFTSNVVGVKEGRTAVQLGAGINVPVGTNSSIFADANADIRSRSTSLNGNIGYRYNF